MNALCACAAVTPAGAPLAASALAQGAEPVGNVSEEFRLYIRNEIEKWGRVIRESGARVE